MESQESASGIRCDIFASEEAGLLYIIMFITFISYAFYDG